MKTKKQKDGSFLLLKSPSAESSSVFKGVDAARESQSSSCRRATILPQRQVWRVSARRACLEELCSWSRSPLNRPSAALHLHRKDTQQSKISSNVEPN